MSSLEQPTLTSAARREDELEIRWIVERWVIWRDAGDWDRFASLWHPQGRMNATWFSASAPEFIARCRRAFDEGARSCHILGGSSVDVQGDRAIAQTKMQILQRAKADGVEADVACLGRFFDFFQRWEGRWTLYLRQPIYELDSIAPVDPSAELSLDQELLASYPVGYRHLAYVQSQMGFDVSRDLPGARGEALDALMERGKRWLAGEDA